MDPELKQHLDAMEERMRAEFREQIQEAKSDLREQLERVETNLLTEFHKWASPLDARMRTHTATLRALDLEMESLNDRLKKLEPPAA